MKINNEIKEIEKEIKKQKKLYPHTWEVHLNNKRLISKLKLLKQFQKEIKGLQEEVRKKSIVVSVFDDKEKLHNEMCIKVKDINEIFKKKFGEGK